VNKLTRNGNIVNEKTNWKYMGEANDSMANFLQEMEGKIANLSGSEYNTFSNKLTNLDGQ
jgi:hypothetical protein